MNSKDQAILEIFYVKESNNLIGLKKFRAKLKNQIVKLSETTESFLCFYKCLSKKQKISIITQFSLDISRCSGVRSHTHINGLNQLNVFYYA